MLNHAVLFAFSLTLLAGLATGIGSALAFFTKHPGKKFIASSLGFSAGVMIYVSFVDLFNVARIKLIAEHGEKFGFGLTTISFFGGVALIALIDRLVPSYENPHEVHLLETNECEYPLGKNGKLLRTAVFTALAIALHNFPEGMATFASALADPKIGIPIAFAIAIHNIPEGIAISVPIFCATGNAKKAFYFSFLSGLTEPLGAIIAFFILSPFLTPTLLGVLLAGVAGIMVFISLDELLPTAEEYGEHHLAIYGLLAGMLVMATGLFLFL